MVLRDFLVYVEDGCVFVMDLHKEFLQEIMNFANSRGLWEFARGSTLIHSPRKYNKKGLQQFNPR